MLGGLGQSAERAVAGGDHVPRTGDTDLRFPPLVIAHPNGAEHATGGGPFYAVGHDVAVVSGASLGPVTSWRENPTT